MVARKWKISRYRMLKAIVLIAIAIESLINFIMLLNRTASQNGAPSRSHRMMMSTTNGSVDARTLDTLVGTKESDSTTNSTFNIAACLLVKDDNHFLIEWIAYHYHMINMRHLIVLPDPDSRTSPVPILNRWKGRIDVQLWNETFFPFPQTPSDPVKQHRNRQTYFYRACMKRYVTMRNAWVALIDTDEFIRPADETNAHFEPGAVPRHLNNAFQGRVRVPKCLAMHRYQFGYKESSTTIGVIPEALRKAGINRTSMLTTRWMYRKAAPIRLVKNLIDVSNLPPELLSRPPSYTVHRVLPMICPSKNGNPMNHSDSLLIVNHYSGTRDQFHYREDPREKTGQRDSFKISTRRAGTYDDHVSSWLSGFVSDVGADVAAQLLRDVGELEQIPKKQWNAKKIAKKIAKQKDAKCAILLFGLPRAFKSLVLPSLRKNVLRVNRGCDIFVHYYNASLETAGRAGAGGRIDASEVHLLEKEGHRSFYTSDTTESFLSKYGPLIEKIKTEIDPISEKLRYFPWKESSYHFPTTMVNIIKMWHSIESAWFLMKQQENHQGTPYEIVAVLRSDVVFLTPIDVNRNKTSAIVPSFGKHPVSDRMIVGPREAVRVWATERFTRMEDHVAWVEQNRPGFGIHDERLLKWTIFPIIEKLAPIMEDPTTCFLRARADESIWINDCEGRSASLSIKESMITDGKSIIEIVEETIERKCSKTVKEGRALVLKCELQQDNQIGVS